jgi:ATP-dependent Clp protease adapter protein ClpS
MVKIVKFGICVLNDSVNSFEYVVKAFQDIFGWDVTQAGNCANIIHLRGEYVVKWLDSEDTALFLAQVLRGKGLNVKLIIDKNATIE